MRLRFIVSAVLLSGCNLTGSAGLDGSSRPDADAAGEAAAPGDAAPEALDGQVQPDAGPRAPGPLTYVIRERGMTDERLCDVDGDGELDNSFAEVGQPGAALLASAFSAAAQAQIEDTVDPERVLLHFPWVDDTASPHDASTTLIVVPSVDLDEPADDTDDFDGDETYYAHMRGIDGCGEPLTYSRSASIVGGRLFSAIDSFRMRMGRGSMPIDNVQVSGTVERVGGGVEVPFLLCGAATIGNLGDGRPEMEGAPELTMLEVLLVGGGPFGLPAIPGQLPDLDLDGDGLERFVLDGDGHVTGCVDGDMTHIDGAECHRDPRMADAFSLTVVGLAVPAVFGGLHPGWEAHFDEPCEEPPAEGESLWDAR